MKTQRLDISKMQSGSIARSNQKVIYVLHCIYSDNIFQIDKIEEDGESQSLLSSVNKFA